MILHNPPDSVQSAVTLGLAQIEPALTLATLFTKIYKFDTAQNG